ncbi:reverse transcriptase domain-containing protein [Tanacetum coccineum]
MSESSKPTPNVFSKIRRDMSESPRHRDIKRKMVFTRLGEKERGVFNRLGGKGRSVSAHPSDSRPQQHRNAQREAKSRYQGSRSIKTKPIPKKRYHEGAFSHRTKAFSESEDSEGHWKSRLKKQKSEDPEDHLKIFQAAAKVERWAMPTWCHMFNSILTGSARVWFDYLPPESVDSYDDLKEAFLANFLQQNKCIKDLVKIHHIKQREGESTVDFVQRFKSESRHVKGASEQKQNVDKRGDFRNQQRSERRRDMFTLLTKSSKEILALDKGKFKAPPPMSTPVEKRNNNKFYEFHEEVGHDTDECMHLKRQIEELNRRKEAKHQKRNKEIQEEVERLMEAGIMKEVHYHSRLANLVMVKKHVNSWRMCVDFKDMNKSCPKYGYPLPEIDWKVESLCGYPFKCFLDAYKRYHQIKIAKEDEKKQCSSPGDILLLKNAFWFEECWSNLPTFGRQSIPETNWQKLRGIRRRSGNQEPYGT